MSISLDTSTAGSALPGTSLTIPITIAGTNEILVVTADCMNSTDYLAGATVTYNGVSMGSPVKSDGPNNNRVYAWVLANPATGTHNIVITPTASAYITAQASAWIGGDTGNPVGTPASSYNGSASSPYTLTVTCPAAGVIVDHMAIRTTTGTLTPDGAQTSIGTEQVGVGRSRASYKTSSNMQWAFSASAPVATLVAIPLNPTAVLGTVTSAPLKNNTGTVLANISNWSLNVINPTTGALVVQLTGLSTNASGVLTGQSAAITAGNSYVLEPVHATYGRLLPQVTAT